MEPSNIISRLRQFDAYPKTLEDFRVKTFGGAIVTLISSMLMFILFISELNYYLTKEVHPELFVDTSRGHKIPIHIDVTFPRLACSLLSTDAMDASGEQQIDVDHNLFKRRLTLDGEPISTDVEKQVIGGKKVNVTENPEKALLDPNRCESCYGAETVSDSCCNTCESVREAYRKKGWAFKPAEVEQCQREGWDEKMKEQQNEGCQLFGTLEVNKVAGNFHFAPGKSFNQHHVHVHDLQSLGGQKFNMTHKVKTLSFGKPYPGIMNPLDGVHVMADKEQMMFQYFVKIVPTMYVKIDGSIVHSNQFSVTRHSKVVSSGFGDSGLPGMFIMYELSPMMVSYTEKQRSFMHFLTGVCAIIGGIFTVAGLIDSMIYHSSRAIQKKIELGKAS
ncbi:endoplasmic reticulum-Golgi intermediate compartment protein 3 isoform X2 [Octopus sinensis]|uniref:Endoplasmic reticulum-Golgi intermediate compartment protein 3 n=1 Tax=Octopus sinensis TaxID=2607531 RepID=A0A6P7TNN3_9MOLL|nr:endoplasmic reticulum-Golgi intermediate compartment protein 3 isoform X2 [Octopus sinensis]